MTNITSNALQQAFDNTGCYPEDFSSHRISGDLTISSNIAVSIKCSQSVFEGELYIRLDNLSHNLCFEGAEFLKEVVIEADDATLVLSFIKATFHRGIRVFNKGLTSIDFCGARANGKVDISNNHFHQANFPDFKFTDGSLKNTFLCRCSLFSGVANFTHGMFGNASFRGSIFQDSANFEQSTFISTHTDDPSGDFSGLEFLSNADFYRTDFGGTAYFDGTKFGGEAYFFASNHGKKTCNGSFMNVVFEKKTSFEYANFRELRFKDCEFKGIISFKGMECRLLAIVTSIFIKGGDFSDMTVYFSDRETFRIIKNELLRNNNAVEAIKYQSRELNAYAGHVAFHKNPSEYIVLLANRVSNSHGSSWLRGVKFTFLCGLISFIVYLFTLHTRPFQWGWRGWHAFWKAVDQTGKYFFKFFAITHDFNFMDAYGPTSFSFLVDSLSRILVSYGIVQTVQAFRKYGKN